jgi:dephospho-CoA kinase
MPLTVGITGGIASGKSIVAKIIEVLGYPVYYSDTRAKELMNEDLAIKQGLRSIFGESVFHNNQLNKALVASEIFAKPELRQQVNDLVHPAVRADFEKWLTTLDAPLAFQESALLIETGSYTRFDELILVTAPEQLKINRLLERNSMPEIEAKKRIAAQLSDDEKRRIAQWEIANNETDFLTKQTLRIVQEIKQKHSIN